MAFTTPTTTAIVECSQAKFQTYAQIEDPNIISMYMQITFNGISDQAGDYVTFSRNATQLEKQTAVKAVVNQIVKAKEPAVTLSNANIQITGLPV